MPIAPAFIHRVGSISLNCLPRATEVLSRNPSLKKAALALNPQDILNLTGTVWVIEVKFSPIQYLTFLTTLALTVTTINSVICSISKRSFNQSSTKESSNNIDTVCFSSSETMYLVSPFTKDAGKIFFDAMDTNCFLSDRFQSIMEFANFICVILRFCSLVCVNVVKYVSFIGLPSTSTPNIEHLVRGHVT